MKQASFAERLAYLLYASVLRLLVPLYVLRIWWRGRKEPGYRFLWQQRLGCYSANLKKAWRTPCPAGPVIWLHAVSLGETRAAMPLVVALRQQWPAMRLLLTHGTATGRQAGQALLTPGDLQVWLPFDTPGAVRRFLHCFKPAVGILMETEVWPTLQREAQLAGVPMVLANARLSEKSFRQGQRFAWLMQPAVRRMNKLLAQTQQDAQRIHALKHGGAQMHDPNITVCGNIKFDVPIAPSLLAQGKQWRNARPLVMAASTRAGEEQGLLDAWKQLCPEKQMPRLLIVPRHPERFHEVAAIIRQRGLSLSQRSQWPNGLPDTAALAADVWLGDSMGEMPAYYASAQVALLGGSFANLGGQNLIEAAACGCPVVMGPSTYNFEQAAQLSEAAGCAFRAGNWPEAVHTTQQILSMSTAQHEKLANACLQFAQAHQGACVRVAAIIKSVVDTAKH